MLFVSTRKASEAVSLRTAVVRGLAPDGGLYVPERIDPLPPGRLDELHGAPLSEIGAAIASHLVGDEIPLAAWRQILSDALNFPIPLVRVDEQVFALELFHGPTLAFKDVGARVLARLLSYFHVSAPDEISAPHKGAPYAGSGNGPLTVLVATSGDTGGAVAHAFHGVPGTRVVVLYPIGQVSRVQEAQFATLGGNVLTLAVNGTFDDCQRLVKEAFADRELNRVHRLTSANSINIGRLLPQIVYHAHAVLSLPPGSRPVVSVPSGNFGNLTAGVMAAQLGIPVALFIAATNLNDTIPRYLATGRYEPQPSRPTVANAMDVGDPSNTERLRWLFDDDLERMRKTIAWSVHSDDQVRATIAGLLASRGYLSDPHSAIAYMGLHATPRARTDGPRIFLATAHAAKFREVVEPVIGRPVGLPSSLATALDKPNLSRPIRATLEDLRKGLEA
jgi:threonine synthase